MSLLSFLGTFPVWFDVVFFAITRPHFQNNSNEINQKQTNKPVSDELCSLSMTNTSYLTQRDIYSSVKKTDRPNQSKKESENYIQWAEGMLMLLMLFVFTFIYL